MCCLKQIIYCLGAEISFTPGGSSWFKNRIDMRPINRRKNKTEFNYVWMGKPQAIDSKDSQGQRHLCHPAPRRCLKLQRKRKGSSSQENERVDVW